MALFIPKASWSQDNYSIQWFNDGDGLPQNSVKSIFQDTYGYVWLSTENGLARYDGSEFKVFNSTNIPDISSNRMGLFEGTPKKDSVYTINSTVNLLLINNRTVKKISDSLHILSKKKENTNIPLHFNYTAMLTGHHEMRRHDLYQIFFSENAYFKIDIDSIYERNLKNQNTYTYQHNFVVRTQYFIQDNALYALLPTQELYRYQDGQKTKINSKKSHLKNAVIYKNHISEQLFLYQDKNLYLINSISEREIKTTVLFKNIDIETPDITTLFYDNNMKDLYLGSYTKGLGVLRAQYFSGIKTGLSQKNNIEYALVRLNDSTLITGSGTVIQNDRTIATNDFSSISNKYHIFYDRNGFLWTKKNNTLFKLKDKGDYQFVISETLSFDERSVISLLQPKSPTELWLATGKIGHHKATLYTLDITTPNATPKEILKTNIKVFASLIEVNKNDLYIGSRDALYFLNDYKNKPQLQKIKDNVDVRSFYNDGENIWVTTYNQGFFLIKDKQLIPFPLDKKNYLNTAHCIVEDKYQNFWIPTNKGLFKTSKKNLMAYEADDTNKVYYQYFDKGYGFLNNEFNGGCYPCGVTLSNNRIYFPSLSGVVSFTPFKTNQINQTRDIYIDEVEVDGQKKSVGDTLYLDRRFDRVTFFISSPFYEHPYNKQIEVSLSGKESQNWTVLDESNSISYTNLSPGTYTLTARKFSGFDFTYQYKELSVIVPPAFWQELWFQILVVFAGVFVVALLFYLRIRYIQNKSYLLEKQVHYRTKDLNQTIHTLTKTEDNLKKQLWFQKSMINAISHDLKTPIKYLALTSKYAFENDSKTDGERESLELISQSSQQMLQYIDKLLVYAKANLKEISENAKQTNLYQIIEECKELFKLTLSIKQNTIENDLPKELSVFTNQQLLKIIIQNFIDNAIKNTTTGTITIHAEEDDLQVTLFITDTGTGIPEGRLQLFQKLLDNKIDDEMLVQSGLGLKMVSKLLPFINAKALIENHQKGTRVTLVLPKTISD